MIHLVSFDLKKAPEASRKALEYTREDVLRTSSSLASKVRCPFICLVTCGRAEVYYGDGAVISGTLLASALGLSYLAVKDYEEVLDGDDAILHLLSLSTGIDSAYFGEDVIIHQLGGCLEVAKAVGSLDAGLDRLFRHAISFARSVHSSMEVRVFDTDIVDKVSALAGGRPSLVIGSGSLARMVSGRLAKDGCITYQSVRDESKADFLVPAGVIAFPYEERRSYLDRVAVVVSASSAIGYSLGEGDWDMVKDKVLVDLASPSDFPPSFHALDEASLGAVHPRRDAVCADVRTLCASSLDAWKAECARRDDYSKKAEAAFDSASLAVRRLRGPLDLDDEKASVLFETVRKCVISAMSKGK